MVSVAAQVVFVRDLLPALQQAVLASHRYPSTAIGFVSDPRDQARLSRRVAGLRRSVLAALTECARAAKLEHPELRARIAFGMLAELTSQTSYEPDYGSCHSQIAADLLRLALVDFGTQAAAAPRKNR